MISVFYDSVCIDHMYSIDGRRGIFCFFKQKTAYEMRISDWSSDVCSSDLGEIGEHQGADQAGERQATDLGLEGEIPDGIDVVDRVGSGCDRDDEVGAAGYLRLVVLRHGLPLARRNPPAHWGRARGRAAGGDRGARNSVG